MARIERYPRSVLPRLCALCGLLAPITFTVGWVVGGIAQPAAYSLVDDQVSDLGARTADHAWVYNRIGANLTGLFLVVLAYGLWRARRHGLEGKVGVVALAVAGVGVLLDGWFRLDCRAIDIGCDTGGTSWHAVAHQIESLVTVSALLVSAFALAYAFKRSERWRELHIPTLIAGVVTGVLITGSVLVTGLEFTGGGLAMRAGLTVWFAWVALVSYRLPGIARREDERGDPRSAGLVP